MADRVVNSAKAYDARRIILLPKQGCGSIVETNKLLHGKIGKPGNELSLLWTDKDIGEGVFLSPGDALVGNGPCIVATDRQRTLAAHITFPSLIDLARLTNITSREREWESIVFAIANAFDAKGTARNNVLLTCFFIPPSFTVDPAWLGTTENLYDFMSPYFGRWDDKERIRRNKERPILSKSESGVNVDLYALVRGQARRANMKSANEHLIPPNGEFAYSDHADCTFREEENCAIVCKY